MLIKPIQELVISNIQNKFQQDNRYRANKEMLMLTPTPSIFFIIMGSGICNYQIITKCLQEN